MAIFRKQKKSINRYWTILMKPIRLLSTLGLLLICFGGAYYFLIHKPSADALRKAQQAQKQEEILKTRLEHAQTLIYLHQYPEAEKEYSKLLKENPQSSSVKADLARLFYYQGEQDKALNLLKQIPAYQRDEKTKLLMADLDLSLKHYVE